MHHGAMIVSRGKLSLEQYAQTLARASIGVSLMLSPHPSYPPLEMAEFGVQVITNRYANKDLATKTPFIRSVRSLTPEAIAAELSVLTEQWRGVTERDQLLPTGSLFSPDGSVFQFMEELREEILQSIWEVGNTSA